MACQTDSLLKKPLVDAGQGGKRPKSAVSSRIHEHFESLSHAAWRRQRVFQQPVRKIPWQCQQRLLLQSVRPAAILAGMLILVPATASAAETREQADEEELPSLEFLEFLGSFETDSGEWISPGELLQADFDELIKSVENSALQSSGVGNDKDITEVQETDNGDQ